MRNRKTIEIKRLLEIVNQRLRNSTCSDAERDAMSSLLEQVLDETGNYAGYEVLELKGCERNDSRRWYYTHRNL